MRELSEILGDLRQCGASGENEPIAGLVFELDAALIGFDVWPNDLFQSVKALLEDSAFLRLADSWKLVHLAATNCDLSEPQRKALQPVLVQAFDKFSDWMGGFVIAEILGERYADEQALDALNILADNAAMPARSLVPHGLEGLARTVPTGTLHDGAVRTLRRLATSKTPDVQKEALEALARVEAAGQRQS